MEAAEKNKLHSLVLGECGPIGGLEGKGYTIFKNTDEELVAQIKALNKVSDTWQEYRFKGLCKIAQKLNETQCLCVDEAGVYFIKKFSEFASTSIDNLLNEINNKFDVSEYISDLIGPLYTQDGYKKISFVSYKKQLEEYKEHENFKNIEHIFEGWNAMGRVTSKEVGVHLDTYRGIALSQGECGGSSMFCHFNQDGNIVNRDYNYDLKYFLDNKPKTREELIEEIVSHIPNNSYENYGNKWFSNKFAFVLEKIVSDEVHKEIGGQERGAIVFKLKRLENINGSDNYGDRYDGKIKKPKTTINVTRDHLLAQILPLVNVIDFGGDQVDLSKFIDFSKVEIVDEQIASTKLKVGARVTFDKNKEKGAGLLATIKKNDEYPKRYYIKGDGCGHYYVDCIDVNEYK